MVENKLLKNQILHGGFWLVLRENVNLLIRTLGVFVLTRFLAPEHYGIYTAVLAIATFIGSLAELGIHVYLTKYNQEDFKEACSAATTVVLISSVTCVSIGLGLIPLFKILTHLNNITSIAIPLFLIIIVNTFRLVPLGIMERELRYKELSQIEIIAQPLYYIIAIPLAIFKWGAWAPTLGTIVMSGYTFVETYRKCGHRYCFSKDLHKIKEVFSFGFGYSFSAMGWQVRSLILPFVVAPLSNAETVGYIALATRIADSLNVLREATRRVSVGALSKVQSDIGKFRNAIVSGMSYQLIALGPILIVFVLFSKVFVERILTTHWLPIIPLFPFVALNTLCNAFGTVQTAALYVKNKSHLVAMSFFTQHVLIALAAWFFIKQYGMIGYGYALFVPIPAYLLLISSVNRTVGTIKYHSVLIWFFAFAIPLFYRELGYISFLTILLPFLFKVSRDQFKSLVVTLLSRFLPWKK